MSAGFLGIYPLNFWFFFLLELKLAYSQSTIKLKLIWFILSDTNNYFWSLFLGPDHLRPLPDYVSAEKLFAIWMSCFLEKHWIICSLNLLLIENLYFFSVWLKASLRIQALTASYTTPHPIYHINVNFTAIFKIEQKHTHNFVIYSIL